MRITGHEGLALLMGLGARMYEPKIRVVEQRHQSVLAPDREGLVSVMGLGARGFSFSANTPKTHAHSLLTQLATWMEAAGNSQGPETETALARPQSSCGAITGAAYTTHETEATTTGL